jgi:hypothetical protein
LKGSAVTGIEPKPQTGIEPNVSSRAIAASAIVTKPVPNFTRLDPGRPEIAILIEAILRAREVVATRSWSSSQEPVTEAWWADILADPRARVRRPTAHGSRATQKAYYQLADDPGAVIEVACSKCEWKAAFSGTELVALYGAEYPLPNLLDHLAMPGCSKIKNQWDRAPPPSYLRSLSIPCWGSRFFPSRSRLPCSRR